MDLRRVENIMRALDDAAPVERAEVQRLIRVRFVEVDKGAAMLNRTDIESTVVESKNLDEAAKRLGICRRTLQYQMRLLGLPPQRSRK